MMQLIKINPLLNFDYFLCYLFIYFDIRKSYFFVLADWDVCIGILINYSIVYKRNVSLLIFLSFIIFFLFYIINML
ncbi:hypothetical protein CRG95_21580 [Escherichia sp. E4208]|nr:hypothetical protein CRG95_21580 [Escherichia sp. E4208]